jgi:protein disulfide-isomerase
MLTVVVLALAGCSPAPGPDRPEPPSAGPVVASAAVVAAPSSARPEVLGAYDARRSARADIEAALTRAARDGRNVLIDFGAAWCVDCQVLTTLGRTGQVAPVLRDRYHVVSVDVGRFDRNLDVAETYHLDLRDSGIPALVVLGPDGQVRVATNDGSFADARSMGAGEVAGFLTRWSPAAR